MVLLGIHIYGCEYYVTCSKDARFFDEQQKRPGSDGKVSLNSVGLCEFLELLWRRLTIFSNIENEQCWKLLRPKEACSTIIIVAQL